jgi:hypothetical protein
VDHLVERGSNETAETDDVDVALLRGGENFLAGDHDAEIDDLVVITREDDPDDVLADVVDIPLDRGEEDLALGLLVAAAPFLLLHVRQEIGDRFFHDAGAFDHLGQKHFAVAEEIPDDAHAFHQRAFDDFERGGVLPAGFLGVEVDEIDDALDQRVGEPFLDGQRAPLRFLLRFGFADFLVAFGEGDEALGAVLGSAVEEDILNEFAQLRLDLLVDGEHAGVDDAHVEPGADRMVKKDGVHRFADRIVAAEGKRNVADAAGNPRAGEIGLDPAGGLDEIDRIVIVLLDAGGDGEDVGIEDDVLGWEADFLRKNIVGAGADFDAAREGIGLALFVEGHDDGGGAVAADELGSVLEKLFAFLEADGIDDGLAGDAAESGFDHAPLGAVDHDGDPGDFEFRRDEVEKAGHGFLAVEHAFVEVDVDDGGAAFDLLARDGNGFVEFIVEDQLGKFRRAGDVGAFADERERDFGAEG